MKSNDKEKTDVNNDDVAITLEVDSEVIEGVLLSDAVADRIVGLMDNDAPELN